MLGVLQFTSKSLVARQKFRLSQSATIKMIQNVIEYKHKKLLKQKAFLHRIKM